MADLASSVLGSQFPHARSILRGKTQSQDIGASSGEMPSRLDSKIRLKMVAPEVPLVRCGSDMANLLEFTHQYTIDGSRWWQSLA